MPGIEPGRECLAVPARQLAVQPGVPLLPRHPRPLLPCLEQAHSPALEDHVARPPRLGSWMLINGIWYYNSCRNRHCPKCQAAAAKEWLTDRRAELLPVPYFHVVFTLPRPVADIAYQNKSVVYDLLLKTAAETLITIAADPKHLGARIGLTAVLHTWGSALTHHPHAHIIVPGGGLSPDGQHWIAGRPGFFLSNPRPARRVPPHPALRPARQRQSNR